MNFIFRYLGMVAAVFLTFYLVPGIHNNDGWLTVFLAALVWSIIATTIRPVLQLLTLPVTIVTFGISSLVLNALLFWGMALVVPGLTITSFWWALLGVLVLSMTSGLISLLFEEPAHGGRRR